MNPDRFIGFPQIQIDDVRDAYAKCCISKYLIFKVYFMAISIKNKANWFGSLLVVTNGFLYSKNQL